MKPIIIELSPADADVLMALVHLETLDPNLQWKETFSRIKTTIDEAIKTQHRGGFFQCSACREDCSTNPKPDNIRQNSP